MIQERSGRNEERAQQVSQEVSLTNHSNCSRIERGYPVSREAESEAGGAVSMVQPSERAGKRKMEEEEELDCFLVKEYVMYSTPMAEHGPYQPLMEREHSLESRNVTQMYIKGVETMRPSMLGSRVVDIVPISDQSGKKVVRRNVYVDLPPLHTIGGPIDTEVLISSGDLCHRPIEPWNVTVRCLHQQREFLCIVGEGYRARRVDAEAVSLLPYREQWLSMCIVKSSGTVIYEAMLGICESLHTMAEWVKADSRCLNR